jgi:RNA polymerase sigma factor (sigma-70 family)
VRSLSRSIDHSWAHASDDELIDACRADDRAAWAEVVRRYERLVLAQAHGYGLDGHAAADVAQITFAILVQSLDRLQPGTRLAPWLATVARRHTWRSLNQQRREPADGDDREERCTDVTTEDQRVDAMWLADGLARMGSRCRQLLEILYLRPDQPSYADIAVELDIPIGAIGPTRGRCLAKLRTLLEPAAADEQRDALLLEGSPR